MYKIFRIIFWFPDLFFFKECQFSTCGDHQEIFGWSPQVVVTVQKKLGVATSCGDYPKFLGGRHNLWRLPKIYWLVATTCGDYPKFLCGRHNLWCLTWISCCAPQLVVPYSDFMLGTRTCGDLLGFLIGHELAVPYYNFLLRQNQIHGWGLKLVVAYPHPDIY